MTAPSITEFLLARIAEDEAYLSNDLNSYDSPHTAKCNFPGDMTGWCDCGLRDKLLAECAAKRAIVELYERHRENRDARRHPRARAAEDYVAVQDRRKQEARTRVAEDVIFHLAAVYRNHPDYQHEWTL